MLEKSMSNLRSFISKVSTVVKPLNLFFGGIGLFSQSSEKLDHDPWTGESVLVMMDGDAESQ